MTEYSVPLLLSSSSASGAFNVTTGKDAFDAYIERDVKIPNNAKQVTVEVNSASVWFTHYNISASLANNLLYLDVSGDAVYTVTLEDGLYDLSSIAHAINVSLVNQGLTSNIITFTGDTATNRVVINFSAAGLRIDFSAANTCREILGFASAVTPVAYTTASTSVYGASKAVFNHVDHFLIHSDVVSSGIPINGTFSNVIARVLIDVSPGRMISYTPNEPIRVPAPELAGANITKVHSSITDQDNGTLDFNDEDWNYLLVIRYKM